MIKRFFNEGRIGSVRNRVAASLGIKFVLATTVVILAFMLAGTLVAARMLLNYQFQTIEDRGRETAKILGKAFVDRLIASDRTGINTLVEDVVKSPDILSVVIVSMDGLPITSAQTSFNRGNEAVKMLLAREKTDDVIQLLSTMNSQLLPIDVSSEILFEGIKFGEVKMAFSRSQAQANVRNVAFFLIGISTMISGVLSTLIYVMVKRMITIPIGSAEAAASKIAAGDLSQSVRVQSVDELGMLGRGLNKMIIGLKNMIVNVQAGAGKSAVVWDEVRGISQQIASGSKVQAEAVEDASSSVNEMHYSLKEIVDAVNEVNIASERTSSTVIEMTASIGEVAKTAVDLASFIEDTSKAITQLSAAVRQIADNTAMLSSSAEETSASAAEISASVKEVELIAKESAALAEAVASDAKNLGMRSIEKTIEGMNRIETTARRTADVVNRLGEKAENIGSILTVIEDITDQTGLLALNAAILAAQAGEHGKGFAVVAAEIRELANRTAGSTQEIGKLIASVQEESRDAVGVMREEVEIVAEGVQLAHNAGEALMKILERADQSRTMSGSISKAAAEQARGMKQVSDAIDRINEMSHQIARAVHDQTLGSDQIAKAADKMRELTGFVRISTGEQARGSKDMSATVEAMTTKIRMVHRASSEVQAGSDLIVKAIEQIKDTARSNADLAGGLSIAMEVMVEQTAKLNGEIAKFKT